MKILHQVRDREIDVDELTALKGVSIWLIIGLGGELQDGPGVLRVGCGRSLKKAVGTFSKKSVRSRGLPVPPLREARASCTSGSFFFNFLADIGLANLRLFLCNS